MKIAKDKWNHIYVGLAIGLILPFAFNWIFHFPVSYNLLLSATMLAMVSYGFELFSLITGWGHYDFMDAVATFAGGIPALGVAGLLL